MLSLAALLEDPALELRLLVPGRPGALGAEAVWVHNTELPDPSPYLREHEVVLTNGLWLDDTEPAEFVDNVVRAKGAGIIFGLRAELDRTPGSLITACRGASLPLVEISVAVPFTAVTRAAAALDAAHRQDALLAVVARGYALAEAISHGTGAVGVLDVLRRDHPRPLAVVDRVGRPLAAAGAELDDGQLLAVAAALGRRPPSFEVELGAAGRCALFPVGALGDPDATLVCLCPAADLTPGERDALDQAARYLSLEITRQQAVRAIELRIAGELLDMILSGSHRSSEVPGRLRALGIDPDGPLAVCAVALAAPDQSDGDDAPDAPTRPGMTDAVGDFLQGRNLPAVVAGGSQDVVAVLPWRRPQAELAELAEALAAAVGRRFDDRRTVVGLHDSTSDDATELRRPLVRSREACRVLRTRRGGPVAATLTELGTYRLLLDRHDGERLRDFADTVLGRMRAHDRRRGGELERTLRAFLDHDGQWNATASALYVHVNTLRNRLARIAELTDRDVGRTADRVELFLALEVAPDRGTHES